MAIMIIICIVLPVNIGLYVVQVIYAYYNEIADFLGIRRPQVNTIVPQ